MPSIFDQPHIFIVYPPGAGGNFVSKICRSIQLNQFDTVNFPQSGSSHIDIDRKMLGTDFLSFGTIVNNSRARHHSEQRILNYLENIKISYEAAPHVAWTHDFSNIILYKKYFPNSKIIAITQDTEEEKLTILFMRLLKTNLSDDANKPFTKEEELRFMFTWKFMVRGCLLALGVPGSIADTVANDIKNSKYYDIVNYASMKSYLHYYGIAGIFDKNYRGVDVTNKMFYPLESSIKFLYDNHKKPLSELKSKITPENWDKFPREIGNDISDYLTDDVIVLPYKTIIDNQSNKFVDTINTAFNQQLNSQAKTYIADTFKKYINSQHQLILQNPKQYYHDSYILYSNALISLMSGNNE